MLVVVNFKSHRFCTEYFYRPQRKDNVFTSVYQEFCPQWRGEMFIPACNGRGCTPPGQTSPLGNYPTLGRHPLGNHPTLGRHPPGRHPLGNHPTLGRHPLGRHPLGRHLPSLRWPLKRVVHMHSCWGIFSIRYLRYNFIQNEIQSTWDYSEPNIGKFGKTSNSGFDVVDLCWPSNMATIAKSQQKMAPVAPQFKIETFNENWTVPNLC